MTCALQFVQVGERQEARQVDGVSVGYIAPSSNWPNFFAVVLNDSIFFTEHEGASEARHKLIEKYARRFSL